MAQGYIDFYGYDKLIYDKITQDFIICIKEHSPSSVTEPIFREWKRCERTVLVNPSSLIDEEKIDKCMTQKGYQRYRNYNFYTHV